MKDLIAAFPPILEGSPEIMILGTMPGGKSLELGQYYSHPQNQFWRLMGDIYGAARELPYAERIKTLTDNRVAVWDVLKTCVRAGSMDANIKNPIANNFNIFFSGYPSIKVVVFDSGTAANFYKRLVAPTATFRMEYRRVPSPSPAHARLRYEEKLTLWKRALTTPPGEFSP
jgi:TDG/mug DNA glycosylase family protein